MRTDDRRDSSGDAGATPSSETSGPGPPADPAAFDRRADDTGASDIEEVR